MRFFISLDRSRHSVEPAARLDLALHVPLRRGQCVATAQGRFPAIEIGDADQRAPQGTDTNTTAQARVFVASYRAPNLFDRKGAPQQEPLYSITSSARASSVGGIVRPSAFAVLRLMTSSKVVACCTGRSAGFSPLRILAA